MKIAIDLNDVVRDFTDNFIRTYLLFYNRELDTDLIVLNTNDMEVVLPFKTNRAYNKFVYEDYTYELFGKCDVCTRNLQVEIDTWMKNLLDEKDDIEIMFTSTKEFGDSLSYTYFFISKLNCNIREIYLPIDSRTIWDKCDILITANPELITSCPEDKKVVKIKTEYNKDIETKYEYNTLSELITDENKILKIIEDEE